MSRTQLVVRSNTNMDLSIYTLVMGMVLCFTVPLLVVTCILVYIVWSRHYNNDNLSKKTKAAMLSTEALSHTAISHVNSHSNSMLIWNNRTNVTSFMEQTEMFLLKSVVMSTLRRLMRSDPGLSELSRIPTKLTNAVIMLNPVIKNPAIEYTNECDIDEK